ncbi:hypothetical protein RDE2_03180 [Rhodococcus sp. RDE2]|nr:hypothetical protein RDE2_03180 [Rhodococcus sp. RDE2]
MCGKARAFEPDMHAVGEQDTFEFEDGIAGFETETAGQLVVGDEIGPRDEHTPGAAPFEQGGLGVGTDDERLDDLRSGDDGAAAPPFDATVDEQFPKCLTDGFAGDVESCGEIAFGRDLISHAELVEEALDLAAHDLVLEGARFANDGGHTSSVTEFRSIPTVHRAFAEPPPYGLDHPSLSSPCES